MSITISDKPLSINDVVSVARHFETIKISPACLEKVKKCRSVVERFVDESRVVYGITTGFGAFKDIVIDKNQVRDLQANLIMSHAVSVGDPFSEEEVRASTLVRLKSLSCGHSGIRPIILETLAEMLNKKIYPYIPKKGSVGSSGDLSPLSHLILVMMGMGEAFVNGKRIPGKEAMRLAGITPVVLEAKEGLASNNGTAFMTGIGALAVYDAMVLYKTADIIASITAQAVKGTPKAFDPRIHNLRAHKGQLDSAKNLVRLTADSKIMSLYKGKVQDSYSIRCIPQVHGASRNSINHAKEVIDIELQSVTDNPLIFPDDNISISGGNFHGEPIAQALDILGIGVSELGNISERRTAKIIDSATSDGLPTFLITEGGLNNGFMIPQYTSAALVSENKILAHPASVDSVPTSANQEDHVSMGSISANKARDILDNVRNILAIELMCSLQAMDLRGAEFFAESTKLIYTDLRMYVKFADKDRVFYPDIHKLSDLIRTKFVLDAAEEVVGKLD